MAKVNLPVLRFIETRIAARAEAIREAHPFWPCKAGCDHCCRSLPHLPVVTRLEWKNLCEAIAAQEDGDRRELAERIRSAPQTGPVSCPLLDDARGTCTIYEARPVACRTYGYYTEWDAGLHCEKVERAVREHGATDLIVWGNGEAIAQDLAPLGAAKPLDVWLREEGL